MNSKREIESSRDDLALKSCCANVYQSEWTRLLLGDSFHPGGAALTRYLGAALHLGPDQRVLDVAAGQGTSAIHLAQCFGCTILGIEYSRVTVERATQRWLVILVIVVALYLALVLSHALLGFKVLPW